MNIFKKISVAAAVCASALVGSTVAEAQGYLDAFAPLRTVQLNPGLPSATNFTMPEPAIVAIDYHGGVGVAVVDLTTITNVGANTNGWTASPQESPDETNWTIIPYAIGTNYTAFYTNYVYGTNFIATNVLVLPGQVIGVSTATAGDAVGGNAFLNYIQPAQFTNTGSTTLKLQGDTMFGIPLNGGSGPNRYFRLVITNAAAADVSATNSHFAGTFKFYYNQQ